MAQMYHPEIGKLQKKKNENKREKKLKRKEQRDYR